MENKSDLHTKCVTITNFFQDALEELGIESDPETQSARMLIYTAVTGMAMADGKNKITEEDTKFYIKKLLDEYK